MNKTTFLQNYHLLQFGIMADRLENLGAGWLTYNNIRPSPVWNHIFIPTPIDQKQLEEFEKRMILIDRNPSLYFERNNKSEKMIRLLKRNAYTEYFEDSWMFFDNNRKIDTGFSNVQRVKTQKGLDLFLDTLDTSFRNTDPEHPYELGNYLQIAKKAWNNNKYCNKLEYFSVLKNNKVVSVATLTNFNGIGYISNVGSLPSVRGQGFGKLATLYCIEKSREYGNTIHCLATGNGTHAYEFYKRNGFKTKFTATCYVKK